MRASVYHICEEQTTGKILLTSFVVQHDTNQRGVQACAERKRRVVGVRFKNFTDTVTSLSIEYPICYKRMFINTSNIKH